MRTRLICLRGVLLFAVSVSLPLLCAHAEEKAYEKIAAAMTFDSDQNFQPKAGTLAAGQLSCPSTGAFATALACASQLVNAPDMREAIVAECTREEAKIGCEKTRRSQPVTVLAVYDLTIPGSAPNKRLLAKVRAGQGADRYVAYKAVGF